MSDESILMITPASGGAREAPLLWTADEILSVRDSKLQTELQRDVDWTYKDGMLRLTEGSRASFVGEAELWRDGQPRIDENHWHHTKELFVTYHRELERARPGRQVQWLLAIAWDDLRSRIAGATEDTSYEAHQCDPAQRTIAGVRRATSLTVRLRVCCGCEAEATALNVDDDRSRFISQKVRR